MIKVTPYIHTIGNEKFKQFLLQPFGTDILYSIDDNKILFEGWRLHSVIRSSLNCYSLIDNEHNILEFMNNSYYIIHKSNVFTLPNPITINDFINDVDRIGVQLYWTKWIDENFYPKDYLPLNEIENYFRELLSKMGKSHELL